MQRRCLTLNCRSRALSEVSGLCPLLFTGHPIPFISFSKLGVAVWSVLNVQTSFLVCSEVEKSAGEMSMSTFLEIPVNVARSFLTLHCSLAALVLACSCCLITVRTDCSHLGKAAGGSAIFIFYQAGCAAFKWQSLPKTAWKAQSQPECALSAAGQLSRCPLMGEQVWRCAGEWA